MGSTRRTRSRGGFVTKQAYWRDYNPQGALTSTYTYTYPSGVEEIFHDTVTKPFIPGKTIVNNHSKKIRVQKIRKPAVGSATCVHDSPAYNGASASGERYYDWDADLINLGRTLNNIDITSLRRAAATQALSRLNQPDVAGLVAIKEIRSTLNTLRNPVNGALNFLKNLLKGRSISALAKDASNQHLTVIFGIMPFINDVRGTLKVLEEQLKHATPRRLTARGLASSVDSKNHAGSFVNHNDGYTRATMHFNHEVTRTVTVRAYVLYETTYSLPRTLGLSLEELPRSVWQTIPLSFVVDWLVNVSQVIAALTPQPSVNILASGYTVQEVEAFTTSYKQEWVRNRIGWQGFADDGEHTNLGIYKTRVPGDLRPFIGFSLKHNMHSETFDTFKITAAISLLIQRLLK